MYKIIISLIGEKASVINNRLFQNEKAKRTFTLFSLSFLLILLTIMISGYTYFTYSKPIQRPILYVNLETKEINDLISMPHPIQSRESLENWVTSAVIDLNSFSFYNFDQQIEKNRKYFLNDHAFNSYVAQLEMSDTKKNIIDNSIIVTTVLLKTPIQTNSYQIGENIYWTYSVPVLISQNNGSNRLINEKKNINVTLVRVPSYLNHAGLAIVSLN